MKTRVSKRIKALAVLLVVFITSFTMGFASIMVSAEGMSPQTTGHDLLAGYNALAGGNITAGEGISSALKMFNTDKFSDLMKKATYDDNSTENIKINYGRDMKAFAVDANVSLSRSLGGSVGIEKLFKFAISSKFSLAAGANYSQEVETLFYDCVVTVKSGTYSFDESFIEEMKKPENGYLTDSFLKALTGADGKTPEEFFAYYGTHFVTAYTAGGQAGVYSSTINYKDQSGFNVSAEYENNCDASVKWDGFDIGLNKSLSFAADVKAKFNNEHCQTETDTYAYGGEDAVAFTGNTFKYEDWSSSIKSGEKTQILADERFRCVPIWELMPEGNEDRALALRDYFMEQVEADDAEFYEKYGLADFVNDYSQDWLGFNNATIIYDEQDLYDIRNNLNGVYVLANNIVLDEYQDWQPIGTKENPFKGRLYGNYNTISNFNLNVAQLSETTDEIALFGCNDGLITDLKLNGTITLQGADLSGRYVGSICAFNDGIVNNCMDNVKYDVEYAAAQSGTTYVIEEGSGLYLTGQTTNAYSNLNVEIADSGLTSPVYVFVDNVNMTGSNANGTIYNPTQRDLYLISCGEILNKISGKAGAEAQTGTIAINSPNADVKILGNTALEIYGGVGGIGTKGADSSGGNKKGGTGSVGYAGGNAILTSNLYVSMENALAIYGGTGGIGGRGGNSPWKWFESHGGDGGVGANGVEAIVANEAYFMQGDVIVSGGNGGTGGFCGQGGDGIGRVDGSGGVGGNGASAFPAGTMVNRSSACNLIVLGGQGGRGGQGGNAVISASGVGSSPRADISVGNKQYVLYDTAKTWDDAKNFASSLGGHLVTITSEQEQDVITHLLQYGAGKNYWLGARRSVDNLDLWQWVTDEKFEYTNWATNQPDTREEYYLGSYNGLPTWNDFSSTSFGFIVEYDLNGANLINEFATTSAYLHNTSFGKVTLPNTENWQKDALVINSVDRDATYYTTTKAFSSVFQKNAISVGTENIAGDWLLSFDGRLNNAGMSSIVVSYGDYKRLVPIYILQSLPVELDVINVGKTEFVEGEEIQAVGLEVVVSYNSGEKKTLHAEDFSITYPTIHGIGQKGTVKAEYLESKTVLSFEYQVSIVSDPVVDMYVVGLTDKHLIYKQGASINLDGLTFMGTKKSGAEVEIELQYVKAEITPNVCTVGNAVLRLTYVLRPDVVKEFDITILAADQYQHQWDDGVITLHPTHLATGTLTYTCVNGCGSTKTEEIAKLDGHTYGLWYHLDDEHHQRACACGEVITSEHLWNDGVVTTPATHLEFGEKQYECTLCDATKTVVVEKEPTHTFGDWQQSDSDQHVRICECGEKEYAAHLYDGGRVTVDPTYTSVGELSFVCMDCGYVKTEEIPALEIPEGSPFIEIDNKNAVLGNTISVSLRLKNNPGITSMRVVVEYDTEWMVLTNVEYNAAMGGQSILPENVSAVNGKLILYWADGFKNYSEDGLFAKLTFNVSADAPEKSTTNMQVSYLPDDIYNVDEENVTFFVSGGNITFINYIPGDINGDGVVNTKDTTRLMRYLAGWDVEVNEYALDVNGDGVVNTKDTTRLMQYLAGWNVEIF